MLKKIFKILFPLLIFGFLIRSVLLDWENTKLYLQEIKFIPLTISFLCMIFIYPQGGFAWFRVLESIDSSVQLNKSLSVWIISNTSRYIPGTIWQYLGRMELAKSRLGVTRSQVGLSLVGEVFLSLAAAGLLSLVAIFYIDSLPNILFFILLPFSLLLLHPKMINILIQLLIKLLKKKFKNIELQHNFSNMYSLLLLFLINFFLNGLALYFLVIALGQQAPISYLIPFTVFYALSWLIGYLTLISPGGLGIMEGSLVLLLSQFLPVSFASIVAILYRFFLTLAEGLVFIITLIYDYGNYKKLLGRKS